MYKEDEEEQSGTDFKGLVERGQCGLNVMRGRNRLSNSWLPLAPLLISSIAFDTFLTLPPRSIVRLRRTHLVGCQSVASIRKNVGLVAAPTPPKIL